MIKRAGYKGQRVVPTLKATANTIPEASLRRLPLYHRLLKQFAAQGLTAISCPQIALQLNLDPTQVRKDLEAAQIAGRPKVGYQILELLASLEHFLGWDNLNQAFLAGVGNLGMALLGYSKFEQCGLSIVAAFDSDPAKAGSTTRNIVIHPIERLPELATEMRVNIGVITTPPEAAQGVADLMVQGGIRAIWNFAPTRLVVPEQVILRNEDLYCSLASLSQKLAAALRG